MLNGKTGNSVSYENNKKQVNLIVVIVDNKEY
jgi:hypothetical protein